MGHGLRAGPVSVPRWILGFRALQLFFAILTLAMTAYSLSVFGGGPIQPPLIATIIISILTIIPILLLTTPLHLAQRRMYDPRIALFMDGFAMLYWLSAFAALASYQDIFRYYGHVLTTFDNEVAECFSCRRAWRTGVAATVFSAIEFLLFLFTTTAFIYYYHLHLSGASSPGVTHNGTHKTETGAAVAGTGATTAGATGGAAGFEGEHHQMSSSPQHTNPAPAQNGAYGNLGNPPTAVNGNGNSHYNHDVPYPTNAPRSSPGNGAYVGV